MAAGFTQYAATQRLSSQLQFVVHELSKRDPIILDIVRTSDGTLVATKGIGTAEPTGNPFTAGTYGGETVYWEKQAKFLIIGSSDEDAAIVYNQGTRDTPSWVATDTAISKADLLAILGSLAHTHTSSAVGTFTGTAGTSDPTTVVDGVAGAGDTQVYVGLKRADTSPAVLISENAASATAYFQTAAGLSVPVIYQAVEESDIAVDDDDGAAALGGQLHLRPLSGPNRWGAMECELVAEMTSRANVTFTTATPTDSVPIKYFEEVREEPIPLASLRELSAGDIINAAGIGGVLAKDTTPILQTINGGTDQALSVNWAAGNADEVYFQRTVTPDTNTAKDMRIHFRAYMLKAGGAVVDNPIITVKTYFDEGDTAVSDVTLGVTGDGAGNAGEYYATIAAADIPAGAKTMSCVITPAAHATDALVIDKVAVQWHKLTDLIPVYFDEDAATTSARFVQACTEGVDCYVRMNSGRPWKFTYSATAAADGVGVYVDDNAGGGATQLLVFTSPTDTNGTATTGTQAGIFALDGIALTALYTRLSDGTFVFVNTAGVNVPVWTLSGNREFVVNHVAAVVGATDALTYFDDNGATADEKLKADFTGAGTAGDVTVNLSTAEYPFGKTPVGTIAVTPTVNTSGALIS